MKIFYIVLALLLVYWAVNYGRYKYILSRASLAQIKHEDLKLGQGPELRYIAAGDSTAVGEGATNAANTYPNKIAEFLAQKNLVIYRNVGISGARTQDVIDKQVPQIISYNPDVVTITIGVNDVTHWETPGEIVANYQKIISQLTAQTHAKIYISNVARLDKSTLLPWPLRMYFDQQAKSTNLQLARLETDRVKIVDIHSVEVNFAPDQFHPSDIGYKFWLDAFLNRIKQ